MKPIFASILIAFGAIAAWAQAPAKVAPTAAASAAAETQAKGFVALLAAHDFAKAEAELDATMAAALPLDKLTAAWQGVEAQAGKYVSTESAKASSYQQYQIALVTCRFEKARLDVKVVLGADGKVSGLFFQPASAPVSAAAAPPAAYVKAGAYREEEVVAGSGEWKLPGTLTLPAGKGPFPAVVLVQGSGPNDRDETVGANKPFRDLALGLASQGIAVLRYEKRTKQFGAQMGAALEALTVKEETTDDAEGAVALLRRNPAIDGKRIFVLGHSLGGMLLPRILAADPSIAGGIAMAGAVRPLEDLVVEQTVYQSSLAGAQSAEAGAKLDEIKKQAAAIKGLSKGAPQKGNLLGAPASYWLDLQGYNPAAAAKPIARPMLILQGENDCQVSMKDFELWRQALSARKDVVLKSYPGLNHLFIETPGKSTGAEYATPGHVAGPVVNDIAQWLKAH